jgi:hypothetical protein
MEIKKGNKIIEQVRDSVARWGTFAGQAGVQNDVRKHISDLHMKL